LSVETHILNFDKQVYSEMIKINFINRIRDEVKFNTISELKQQLVKDNEYAYMQEI